MGNKKLNRHTNTEKHQLPQLVFINRIHLKRRIFNKTFLLSKWTKWPLLVWSRAIRLQDRQNSFDNIAIFMKNDQKLYFDTKYKIILHDMQMISYPPIVISSYRFMILHRPTSSKMVIKMYRYHFSIMVRMDHQVGLQAYRNQILGHKI